MKAVVFDIDGTLVDSMGFWKNLGRNYLISQGAIPKDDLNRVLDSLTVMEGVAYMKEEYKLDKTCSEIKYELDQLLLLYYKKDAKLKPFAAEVVKLLKDKNIRLAIASVIDEKLIYYVLQRYNIYKHFEFVQTCENTNLGKDNEDFFNLLSERLNMNPKNIFLFEDSLYSMKAAKSAGLKIVAMEEAYSKKDLEKIIEVADIYIKDFSYLISFLK